LLTVTKVLNYPSLAVCKHENNQRVQHRPDTIENILILLAFYNIVFRILQTLIDRIQGNDNTYVKYKVSSNFVFGATDQSGPGPPHLLGFSVLFFSVVRQIPG
jgi:hypothetical protein